jgi:peptidoglycan/LPS O-acetylase OafA/YrhL
VEVAVYQDGRAAGPYIPALDGIRALAVAAVLLFHGGAPFAPGGYLGVSLFFTLSGFLMGSLLLREHAETGRIALGHFWERRFRRLLPAALLTLAGVAALAPHLGGANANTGLRGDIAAAAGYVANWRFLAQGHDYRDLFEAPSPVLHFWSLSIEEQFYVGFPLLVAGVCLVARRRVRALAVVLAAGFVASAAAQLLVSGYDRAYYGTDTRAGELLAGALLACAVAKWGSRVALRGPWGTGVGVAALVGFAAFLARASADASWIVHGGFVLVSCCSVLLLSAALGTTPLARAFAVAPLVAIGRVSYGLYLFHWPVFLWFDTARTGYTGVQLFAVRMAITVAVTVVSYHLLECPIRYRRVLVHRPRFVGVIGASTAIALALATVAPRPSAVSAALDQSVFVPVETSADVGAAVPVSTGPPPRRIMVVGDSTGSPVAAALSREPNMNVLDASRPGCPLLGTDSVADFATGEQRSLAMCTTALPYWQFQAREFRPDLVLVFTGLEDVEAILDPDEPWPNDLPAYLRALAADYGHVADALRASGAVVAWADTPYLTVAAAPDVRAHEQIDRRVDVLNFIVAQVTAGQLGTVALDFASHVNAPDRTVDLTYRPDGIHLASTAARAAADTWLAAAVDDALAQGRTELGEPTDGVVGDRALRVLVTGDSTSLGLASGLANHARAHRDFAVDWAGEVGCPLIDATRFKLVRPEPFPVECAPAPARWELRIAQFKPDVVVVFSSFMDALETEIDGVGWRHVGQADYDERYAAQIDTLATIVDAHDAVLVWADAPPPASAEGRRMLSSRFDSLNALIAEADARWPNLQVLPWAEYLHDAGLESDKVARPDGIHFAVDAANVIAEHWLAEELVERVQAARDEVGAAS